MAWTSWRRVTPQGPGGGGGTQLAGAGARSWHVRTRRTAYEGMRPTCQDQFRGLVALPDAGTLVVGLQVELLFLVQVPERAAPRGAGGRGLPFPSVGGAGDLFSYLMECVLCTCTTGFRSGSLGSTSSCDCCARSVAARRIDMGVRRAHCPARLPPGLCNCASLDMHRTRRESRWFAATRGDLMLADLMWLCETSPPLLNVSRSG